MTSLLTIPASILPELSFNAESHRYALSGVPVPGVTGVLSKVGWIDSQWFTEASRERGKRAHRTVELDINGTLDYRALSDECKGYLRAWLTFCREADFTPTHAETILASVRFKYAGMIDVIGLLADIPALIDIKTAKARSPWWPLQLGGYGILARLHWEKLLPDFDAARLTCFNLILSETGKFRVVRPACSIRDGEKHFLRSLRIVQAQEKL